MKRRPSTDVKWQLHYDNGAIEVPSLADVKQLFLFDWRHLSPRDPLPVSLHSWTTTQQLFV